MNKTYNVEDIMSLFYKRFFLESETIISKEQREKLIEEFEQKAADKELEGKKDTQNEAIKASENLSDEQKAYLTTRNDAYFDKHQIFDFVPVETLLRDIKCDGVYEIQRYFGSDKQTIINLDTKEEVSAEELIQKGGQYVMISQDKPKNITFTIVKKGKTSKTEFEFTPKSLQYFPMTRVCKESQVRMCDRCYDKNQAFYSFDAEYYPGQTSTLVDQRDTKVAEEYTSQVIDRMYRSAIDGKSVDFFEGLPIAQPYCKHDYRITSLDPVELATFSAMLNNSSDIVYRNNYRRIEEGNYSPYYQQRTFRPQELLDYKVYCLTEEEMRQAWSLDAKNYQEPKKESQVEKNDSHVEFNKANETKTAKQIRESFEVLKQIQSAGIDLSPEQEQIIYIGEKLNSEEFKEFQAKREERLKRQQEIREKNQRENAEKEARQNSESNNHKSVLIDLKGKLEALEALKAKFPSLVSEEQDKFINEMKEFFMMYEQENTKEHEVDTGMSEESRAWYQEHYKSR